MSEQAVAESVEQEEEKVDLSYVHEVLREYGSVRGAVIVILQKVQDHYGCLPKEPLAPLITVNDEATAHMDADKIEGLIYTLREKESAQNAEAS